MTWVINGRRNRDTCEAVKAEAEALGVAAHVAMGDVGQVDGSNGVITLPRWTASGASTCS
jgi:hypothetical protein